MAVATIIMKKNPVAVVAVTIITITMKVLAAVAITIMKKNPAVAVVVTTTMKKNLAAVAAATKRKKRLKVLAAAAASNLSMRRRSALEALRHFAFSNLVDDSVDEVFLFFKAQKNLRLDFQAEIL